MISLGVLLVVLGVGSLVLPALNLQLQLMEIVDPYQPWAGVIVAAVGLITILFGAQRRGRKAAEPAKATASTVAPAAPAASASTAWPETVAAPPAAATPPAEATPPPAAPEPESRPWPTDPPERSND